MQHHSRAQPKVCQNQQSSPINALYILIISNFLLVFSFKNEKCVQVKAFRPACKISRQQKKMSKAQECCIDGPLVTETKMILSLIYAGSSTDSRTCLISQSSSKHVRSLTSKTMADLTCICTQLHVNNSPLLVQDVTRERWAALLECGT